MFQFLCCRSRHTSRVEVDEVTDSLEKCLSVERGVHEFKSFLERHRFEEESKTLAFALKCQSVLAETARLSPSTRSQELPSRIQNDIRSLYEMGDEINFDLDQMNQLRNLYSPELDKKVRKFFKVDSETKQMDQIEQRQIQTLQLAQSWALDLLQEVYKTFRARALRTL